jgi:site-specific recombinase XerD
MAQQVIALSESPRRQNSSSTLSIRPKPRTKSVFFVFLRVQGWSSDYPAVDCLLRHLARKSRSEASKRSYCWHLYKFCQFTNKRPNELVRLRRDVAERLVQKYADSLKQSPRSANMAVVSLKAFYSSNGYKHIRALDLENYHTPRRFRIMPEYIPTKNEVYRMADSACSLRDRAIILMLFSSGLRNSTLRALLYRDVADELKKGVANVMIPVYPEMKLIDPFACKGNIPYYSFACDEGTQALRLYLNNRTERYGSIKDNEPLLCSEYNQLSKAKRRKTIITSREVQLVVKETAKKAGLTEWEAVHPHCLRKAFETVLHTQLIDGTNMDVKVQEILMGHVLPGSQDNYFDRSKVEWMRLQYSKLRFSRAVVENKFKTLLAAAARAFEGTDIDPEAVIAEYAKDRMTSKSSPNSHLL